MEYRSQNPWQNRDDVKQCIKLITRVTWNRYNLTDMTKEDIGVVLFQKQYGTANISAARQSGHTLALASLVNDEKYSIVLVHSLRAGEKILNEYPDLKDRVIVYYKFCAKDLGDFKVNVVYVDCGNGAKQEDIDNITEICANNRCICVFVGR